MNNTDFDQLFSDYYPALCFFAEQITGDGSVAEELVEDVFVKVWQRSQNALPIEDIRSYLYTATRNASLNYIEKFRREQRLLAQLRQQLPEADDSTEHERFKAEVLRQVEIAIEMLPKQSRKVIQMAYQKGLRSKEIAHQLGVTVSTVDNQKARGLMLLRKLLSSHNFTLLMTILP